MAADSSAAGADGSAFESVTEASTTILFPKGEVFYNPVQCANRDLSVLALRACRNLRDADPKQTRRVGHDPSAVQFRIFEGLSASGLRSIRYAKELESAHVRVVCNDLDPRAVEAIERNIQANDESSRVSTRCGDANGGMWAQPGFFDAIDLDPYGSVAPFLGSACATVKDGGVLCITSTDYAILSGNYPETGFYKYGCVPYHGSTAGPEMGLRVLLHAVAREAAAHKRTIEPLLSVHMDFYARCFVRVRESASGVKENCLKVGFMYHSTQRPQFMVRSLAESDEKKTKFHCARAVDLANPVESVFDPSKEHAVMSGPMWLGPLHRPDFVQLLLDELEHCSSMLTSDYSMRKIRGILNMCLEESVLSDYPFYHSPSAMARTLHMHTPAFHRLALALAVLGYRVTSIHCDEGGIKTSAPGDVVWDILRCFADDVCPDRKGKPTFEFSQPIRPAIREKIRFGPDGDFLDKEFGKDLADRSLLGRWADPRGLKRDGPLFVENPEAGWGPKPAAKRRKE